MENHMNDGMVQLNKVTKAYGSFQLDCSMEVQPGMATGFVGANGAGKTTTFQILLGLVPPETGEIRIFGKPYTELTAKDRERIGVSLADSGFSQFLTVRDVTAILRNLYTRFDEARFLEKCQRYELPANKKIKDFSTGMQAKLKLLIAMSHDADLLILDEPTNHLDMRSKDVLKEAIREFDGTVILVSHDRDFLDGLATKVYEFGGGLVKEHLGGIYEFLQKKKIDSLNELQKGAGLSASPTATAKGNGEQEAVQPSENKLSYEAQKELNKKIKKLERQVADCEASIEETEAAIAIVEEKMATPEGASDMQLYERHQKLKQQLDTIVEEWERVSMELEEVKN